MMLVTNCLCLLIIIASVQAGNITFSKRSLTVQVNTSASFLVNVTNPFDAETTIYFVYQEGGKIVTPDHVENIEPLDNITLLAGQRIQVERTITGINAGNLFVLANGTNEVQNWRSVYMHVYVVESWPLITISQIIGWCYFVAWTFSFYPQFILNLIRKSVIGLNFDFVVYNLMGFLCYSVFNVAFYFVPEVFTLYQAQHPRSVNPVELNDVIFALHALTITILMVVQILIHERGGQVVSRVCLGLMSLMSLFLLISLIFCLVKLLSWLTFIYFFSYCKLFITLIKYAPQAYFNYLRKSTDGWSIGNILLDFTGGSLSILQMILQGYNNDDWYSIFGNPTKFGLGLFSILFDILFMVQHYCLYRGRDTVANSRHIIFSEDEESMPFIHEGRQRSGEFDPRDT